MKAFRLDKIGTHCTAKFSKKKQWVLGVNPRTNSRSWRALFNDTLRSKIGPVVEKLLKFNVKLVFGAQGASKLGYPEGKILIDTSIS